MFASKQKDIISHDPKLSFNHLAGTNGDFYKRFMGYLICGHVYHLILYDHVVTDSKSIYWYVSYFMNHIIVGDT